MIKEGTQKPEDVQSANVTRAFDSIYELARYIHGQYGDQWVRNVRTKRDDDVMVPQRKKPRSIFAGDLDGLYSLLDYVYEGKARYVVFLMYHGIDLVYIIL